MSREPKLRLVKTDDPNAVEDPARVADAEAAETERCRELLDATTARLPLGAIDHEVLLESVKKTGQLILASDACERGSYLHTIAGQIAQIAFDYLDAPVCVVGANNWIVPPAELEEEYFPQPAWLLDAYHAQIKPLPGYTPSTERTAADLLRQSKYGVL